MPELPELVLNRQPQCGGQGADCAGGRLPARLLHVTTIPHSLAFVRGQATFLRARGFYTYAISSPGEPLLTHCLREGAEVYAVPMQRRITPLADLVVLWRIYRILQTVRPHIVHGHTPKGGLLSMLAARLAGVPVRVYTIHGLPLMTCRGWKRLLLWLTESIACRCATRVLSVSRSIRTVATRLRICPPDKITVLLSGSSNGVDSGRRFDPARWDAAARQTIRRRHDIPDDAIVLGYVGRIVRDKGMIELARAWQTLSRRHPKLYLLMVGAFESQDPVPREVEKLFRTHPRIRHAGQVRETAAYYNAMDVCVLPTYREGLPGVLLEAASMELPVVATKVPGCVDAVQDGVTATLVPAHDPTALAEAIDAYLHDTQLRQRHGRAGRAFVQAEFRREALWQAIHEEYVGLLRGVGIEPRASGAELEKRRAA